MATFVASQTKEVYLLCHYVSALRCSTSLCFPCWRCCIPGTSTNITMTTTISPKQVNDNLFYTYTAISKKVAEGFVACCMLHSKTKMYGGSYVTHIVTSYCNTYVSTELKIFCEISATQTFRWLHSQSPKVHFGLGMHATCKMQQNTDSATFFEIAVYRPSAWGSPGHGFCMAWILFLWILCYNHVNSRFHFNLKSIYHILSQ
jgi:hypothetical protein